MPSNIPTSNGPTRRLRGVGMRPSPFLILIALATLIVGAAGVLSGARTAAACSCLFPGTAEAIGESDIVFTGSVASKAGSIEQPKWTFNVDGVVTGEVGPTVDLTGGAIDGVGCGPNFADLNGPITVFAYRTDDGLRTSGCTPNPTAAAFESELATLDIPAIDPVGVGPPAAVMVGVQGPYDLSVLDAEGRAVARAHVGADGRSVAHCPGTTLVALAPRDDLHTVAVVDLTTMSKIAERPSDGRSVSTLGDRIACLDGGERVITAVQDYAGDDFVDVTVSNSAGSGKTDVTRRFTDTRRAVVDDAGVVLLLPTAAGGAIRAVSADDLDPVAEEVALPDGTSAVDADISPDGGELAVLASTGSGATAGVNVTTFDIAAGAIDAASARVTPIVAGDAAALGDVEPTAIRWADSGTWLIEFGTLEESYVANDRYIMFATTDGTESTSPVAAGASRGLVTIDGGVLSSRLNGAELVHRDGRATDLYPPPNETGTIDFLTFLDFDHLADSPAFELPTPPNAPLIIKPVDPNASPVTFEPMTIEPTTEPTGVVEGSHPKADDAPNRAGWVVGVVAAALAVIVVAGLTARSRRRRSNDK